MVVFTDSLHANAVVFDFDGIIVDTEPLHYKAFQHILDPLGLGFSWEEYVETYMGFDDRDAFVTAFLKKERQISKTELSDLVNQKAAVFQDVICSGVTAYPGVIELISKIHTSNIPLAICSGALLSDITPILELLHIADCFDVIVTAEDVLKSKPDPECYQIAFRKLCALHNEVQLFPDRTIAIEDTPAGIQSAHHAGLKVIAVTNSYPEKQLGVADHIVDSLESITQFTITQL